MGDQIAYAGIVLTLLAEDVMREILATAITELSAVSA
jgi:hypothetical protein